MLNQWGGFCSYKQNSFFQQIPKLSNTQIQKVVEIREDLEGVRSPTDPFKLIDLLKVKQSFIKWQLMKIIIQNITSYLILILLDNPQLTVKFKIQFTSNEQ